AKPERASAIRRPVLWTGAVVATAVVAATGFRRLGGAPYRALPVIGDDAPARMLVCGSRPIHGERGEGDGGNVPAWSDAMARGRVSSVGAVSDGGLARKMSNFCNAVVPVRAVRFTAKAAGGEEVGLLDDFVKIFVTDPASLSR